MEPHVKISGFSVSHTDLTRGIIIAALTLVCIVITTFSISRALDTLYAQSLLFPHRLRDVFLSQEGTLSCRCLCCCYTKSLHISTYFPISAD